MGIKPSNVIPNENLVDPVQTAMEEQGNSFPLGPTSSSFSEKHFEGDLNKDKGMESNILAKRLEWVEKILLGLKEYEHTARDEAISLDLTLELGTPVFDQTPVSEIRIVNMAKDDANEIVDEENNVPLYGE